MGMSKSMQKSWDRMCVFEKTDHFPTVCSWFDNFVTSIMHEEGSTYSLRNTFYIHDACDKDYIWVFPEHLSNMIFNVTELTWYQMFKLIDCEYESP